jgi:hypothetical protein
VASILTGIDALIDQYLGLASIGSDPQYHHKRSAHHLTAKPSSFDGTALIPAMLRKIEENWLEARLNGERRFGSRKNWGWEKQPYISDHNSSAEKVIEKAIARECDDDWVNQVPTMSGLLDGYSEKHCNIDLVHRLSHGQFEFIELKIDSNTPLFAAFEVLKYGLVYVFSRQHAAELGYDPANALLNATSVTFSVLAPTDYYVGYDLRWLEAELSNALHEVGKPGLTMNFRFEQFPVGKAAMEIVGTRKPVYSSDQRSSRVDASGRASAS